MSNDVLEKYKVKPLKGLKIALDIDGTVFYHRFPELGDPLPNWEIVKKWADDGAIINVHTMRSDRPDRSYLKEALDGLDRLGIKYVGIQEDVNQSKWTGSPKCHAHLCVDDRNIGTPVGIDDHGNRYVLLDEVDVMLRKFWHDLNTKSF